MIKRVLILILIVSMSSGYATAYSFYITGTITDQSGDPVIGQEVKFYTLSLNHSHSAFTDATGEYSIHYYVENGFYPTFYVQSWEWCHNEFTNNIQTVTSFNGITHINFQMCQQINVPEYCIADFQTQQITDYLWGFINTSRGDIDSIRWNFGNGLTSVDDVIVYTYPDHGLYSVCLTVNSNSSACYTCETVPVGPWEFASGHVEMNNLELPIGQIYVYQLTGNNKENVWTYKVDIENGDFSLPYLLFEDYFIQAVPEFDISVPHFPKYLPTYYGPSLSWENADSLDFTSSVSYYEINLLSHNEIFYGHGSISGDLMRFDTVPHGIDPIWIENNIIPPVTIFLLDEWETTLDFRFFEENGTFNFNDIPYGNYILRTEKFRVSPKDFFITVSEENEDINNIEIQVHESTIMLDIYDQIFVDEGFNIFPNPVKGNLNIQSYKEFNGQVSIYDFSGKIMYHKTHSNSNNLLINTIGFNSGVYFIDINLENGNVIHKSFSKVK